MLKRALLTVLAVLVLTGSAHAGAFDIIGPYLEGEFVLGYLDVYRPTSGTMHASFSVHAEVEIGPGGVTATSTDCQGGGSPSVSASLVGASFEPEGWLNLNCDIDGSPLNMQGAVYKDMFFTAFRTPDQYHNLPMIAILRRDRTLTPAQSAGDYAQFIHAVGYTNGHAVAKYGTCTLSSDATFSASLNCSDGTVQTPAGNWSVADGELTLTPTGGEAQVLCAGPGGIVMDFDIVRDDGYLGYEFLVKKGQDQTISNAEGKWLVQAWYTAGNGYPRTVWGLAEIQSDGSYTIELSDVDGGSETITGVLAVDGDGTVHCTDNGTGRSRDGALAQDGDLLILADMDPASDLGMTVFIREIPEPATLSFLATGALFLLRRRKIRAFSQRDAMHNAL